MNIGTTEQNLSGPVDTDPWRTHAHLTTVRGVSYYSRRATDDRRIAILRTIADQLDLTGAPPTARTLATTHGIAVLTATRDIDVLVTTGMLRRLQDHQPRQRARLAVTDQGRHALALASSPTGATP